VSGPEGGLGDPSPRTAAGVIGAMHAALGRVDGDRSLHGRRVVVSGVGKVGFALCELLAKEGASLVVADVSAAAVDRVQASLATPVELVGADKAHTVACDVFAPCALGGVLNVETVPQLRCAAVVGSANNQFADEACATMLADRGVLYVPDYVANAGGLIQVAGEWLGFPLEEIERRVDGIEHTVDTILATAACAQVTPAAAASQIVARRLRLRH
jgi:glutamate dehydrogenase/leucine dehydrogenase